MKSPNSFSGSRQRKNNPTNGKLSRESPGRPGFTVLSATSCQRPLLASPASARLSGCDSSGHRRNGTAGAQQDTEEGTEISVGQNEESEMEKQRTECGIDPLQGERFIARLQLSSSTKGMRGRTLHFGRLHILICFISACYMHANCIWIAHQYATILWMLEFFYFFLSRLEMI